MLVSEVIDRAYNEWLYPSGINRPMYDKITAGIDASQLTIPLSGRAKNVPRDTVIEIESEQILIESVSGSTLTAAPSGRGWLETGAATHAINSLVWIDPTFTRKAIFNALVTVLGMLYPAGVYARMVDSTTTFSYSSFTKTLPTAGKKIIAITTDIGGAVEDWNPLRPGIDYEEQLEHTPPKYRLLRGGKEGGPMRVVYKADVSRPTTEADDLSSLARPVPEDLQPHLGVGIAGYLLQGREVPRVQIEEIRRRLAAEGIQVGAALNVGQSLLNAFRVVWLAQERDRLGEADSVGLTFSRR